MDIQLTARKRGFLANIVNGIKIRLERLFNNRYKDVNINWFTLKYYKHLSVGKLRSHKLYGHKLFFYNAQELLHGLDEIFVNQIYKVKLNSQPTIIDCGANIGMSVIFMKRLYPESRIIAFEPDDVNYSLLTKNIQSFGYSDVTALKKAVWNENTMLQFSNESSMGSRVEVTATDNTRNVEAVRLKDYLTEEVDFLKIDIEGAETVVLKDIATDLNRVRNMFLEYHGTYGQRSELVEIFRIINDAGFKFYIKEAAPIYHLPFMQIPNPNSPYDVQLNIFCFRD